MNIVSFSSFSQIVFNLKEHFVSLSFKQRVVVIALAALSALVACVIVYRQYFMKAKQVVKEEQPVEPKILQKVLNEQGKDIIKEVTYPDGVIEKGFFVDNRLEGKGEVIFPNGTKCEGFFKYGRLNGEGKVNIFDGSILIGTFRGEELIKGETTSQGVREIGTFKKNKLEGEGQRFYKKYYEDNGEQEIQIEEKGPFKNGQLHGPQGCKLYALSNGSKYEKRGTFQEGKLHGQGEKIYSNGYKEIGSFERGRLCGTGERIYQDGTREIGNFKEGCLDGKGKRVYADKSEEIGEFQQGMLHGQAEIIFSNQTKCIGTCEQGSFQGDIQKIALDGTKTVEKDTLLFYPFQLSVFSFVEATLKFPYEFTGLQFVHPFNPLAFPGLPPTEFSVRQKNNKKEEDDLIERES